MHVGLIVLFFVLVIICGGPAAVLRAVAGLGCLILIAAILLFLLWPVGQIQDRSATNAQPAPTLTQ
jgi:uncharacterized membrane protein YfcA